MAAIADLPLWLRATLRVYRWRRAAPVPRAALTRPLSACRVALVTTAGLVPPGDPPFDESIKGGDWSYRVIDAEIAVQSLLDCHRSRAFDHDGIAADRNLAMPIERLRELAADGVIGAVAPRHLSFMGSITAPGRLLARSVPAATQLLAADGVDIALLVPV